MRPSLVSLVLLLLVAAPAGAASPRPLRTDLPPRTTGSLGADVVHGPVARAARAGTERALLRTGDGTTVRVELSPRYAGSGVAAAQSYVDFLGALTHGPELARLRVYLAPPDEVRALCGGGHRAFAACYAPSRAEMIVPGEEIAPVAGISTAYAVTHEYGHHVAAHRDARPFAAVRSGPRYWSSFERVCARTAAGELARGDYLRDPGENWAEAYARLRWPSEPWRYAPVLAPSGGALAAVRRDVVDPWTAPRERRFAGTLSERAARRAVTLPLRLDGRVTLAFDGPRGAHVALMDGRKVLARGRSGAAMTACRTRPSERLRVVVTRGAASGRFTLVARYPG